MRTETVFSFQSYMIHINVCSGNLEREDLGARRQETGGRGVANPKIPFVICNELK